MFVDLDSAIEEVVKSNKTNAVVLVIWVSKNGNEKIQEDHTIMNRDNQIQTSRDTRKRPRDM